MGSVNAATTSTQQQHRTRVCCCGHAPPGPRTTTAATQRQSELRSRTGPTMPAPTKPRRPLVVTMVRSSSYVFTWKHSTPLSAVKRWALRVNNAASTTDPAAHADHLVDADLDELVLVAHSPARTPHSMPAPLPSASVTARYPPLSANSNSSAAHDREFRRMSTRIDPALLNEFLSTLDEVDAEAVCNFIASYRGPDVVCEC
ncbi:hypothetical protein BCR33DRAFT_558399 [Rhizoclosmatium globosum]|uniref:Uncharacterized protein n=1 Tax=Rhizoclosmatium globosum TaxID=329046 RepID=A0A1Y2CSL0_9FUNG|nr:hypothetical protein BCR33DRAFT_558399 [Rhizoclosmatium globosum]|eukprot:ORY49992.1 hypothetical protein BCR33DRAFT_558399 [Rhizoclosmatium globosum]